VSDALWLVIAAVAGALALAAWIWRERFIGRRRARPATRQAGRSARSASGRRRRTTNATDRITNQEGRVLTYFLLWLLGVPASLLIIFYLLGVGR
jgi:hypothetical protein